MTAETWYLFFNDKKELIGSPLATTEIRDVFDLKLVAEKRLDNIRAHQLVVWRCKDPTLLSTQNKHELQEHLSKIDFLNEKQVDEPAVGIDIPDLGLAEKEVLLVQVPGPLSKKRYLEEETSSAKFLKARAADISAARDAPSPSDAAQIHEFIEEQSERPVRNGRPFSNHGEPIGLYHPVFNEFLNAMENTANFCADADTYDTIRALFVAFSDLYTKEDDRIQDIKWPLRALLGRGVTVIEADGVQIDGAFINSCGETACLLVQQVKNEMGTAGSDPYNQGSLAYRKYWAAEEHLINRCCCPSFILTIAGPWLCISGAVYLEKAIIQPLTDYVWLGGDPFDPRRQASAARLFTALKSALQSLEDYYRTLHLSRSTVSQYPYITEYGAEKTKFKYTSRLAEEKTYSLLYEAILDDLPHTPIVVKFVHQYNVEAHRLLAAKGLAPRLHYSSTEDNVRYGKLFMIVMDYVDLEHPLGVLTKQQYDKVKEAIAILHSNDMVFGDLRMPNILVGKGTAMLIDFDWCGKAGEARYPANMNMDGRIDWHDDVGPDCLMYLDHDDYMLGLWQ